MYAPPQSKITDRSEILRIVRDIAIGCVVSRDGDRLHATHVPVVVKEGHGVAWLEFHVARQNPHGELAGGDAESIAIFQGPQAYIHPGWYASKREHGKVVPTWCYVTVQLHGRLEHMRTDDELRTHLQELTGQMEASRDEPWAVSDAPGEYLNKMRRAITGLRLSIDRMEGSAKLNQHRNAADRAGVADGLSQENDPQAHAVACLMRDGLVRTETKPQRKN